MFVAIISFALIAVFFLPAMGYSIYVGNKTVSLGRPGAEYYYSLDNGTPAHEIMYNNEAIINYNSNLLNWSVNPYSIRLGGRVNYSANAETNAKKIIVLGKRRTAMIGTVGKGRDLAISTGSKNQTTQVSTQQSAPITKTVTQEVKGSVSNITAVEINETKTAAYWIAKAQALKDQGNLNGSLEAYGRALELDPNNRDAWLAEVDVLRALGRNAEADMASAKANQSAAIGKQVEANVAAIGLANKTEKPITENKTAIPINETKTAAYWIAKAQALKDQGNLNGSLEAYGRALELDPNNRDAWLAEADVLRALGRNAEADMTMAKANQLAAIGKPAEAKNVAAIGLANKTEKPITENKTAIPINETKTAAYWIAKAQALKDQGNLNGSLEAYGRALELDPNNRDAWLAEADILRALGRNAEADMAMAKANQLAAVGKQAGTQNSTGMANNLTTPSAAIRPEYNATNNTIVKILGVDSTAFPNIRVMSFVNTSCARAGGLTKEDFIVKENGEKVDISGFVFSGNASGQNLDLAVVFDNTASMGQQIDALKSKILSLITHLNISGLDVRYSLVTFGDKITVRTNWTKDRNSIYQSIKSLTTSGGGDEPEDSLDAIEAALSMGFRPDAQKIIIVVTDAHAHYKGDGTPYSNYTKEEVVKDIKDSGAVFMPVSKKFIPSSFGTSTKYSDLRDISNETQGTWTDIRSAEFSTLLDRFEQILTGTYALEYRSADSTSNTSRIVSATIDKPECAVGSASSAYISP